jgi:putative endonuclease
MTKNSDTGNKGETLACEYLENKGYKVLYTNWHSRHREIDIIASHKNELIVVEVKTRIAGSLLSPESSVGYKKQRLIIEAADAFIQKHDVNLDVRFDIISVVYNGQGFEIEHIENAFYPKSK